MTRWANEASAQWIVLESIADGVLVVDATGTIAYANARIERLLGYTASELYGRSVDMLLEPGLRANHRELRAEYARHSRVREMGGGLEIHALRKDGQRITLDIHLAPLDDGLVVACLRDAAARPPLRFSDDLAAREREARALLDIVVQRLYGISLSIEAAGPTDARTERSAELIDDTIQMIRSQVLEPGGPDALLATTEAELISRWRQQPDADR